MLGVFFNIQSIFTDQNNSFRQKIFLYSIKDIDFSSSNVKIYDFL